VKILVAEEESVRLKLVRLLLAEERQKATEAEVAGIAVEEILTSEVQSTLTLARNSSVISQRPKASRPAHGPCPKLLVEEATLERRSLIQKV
jgi:hypothetical protein